MPSSITVADGGIDAEVQNISASCGQGIIKQGLTRYQIKTGNFSLSKEDHIKSILFKDQTDELKPRVKSCLDKEGARIQTRNNYDLGVFNGDIGRTKAIDLENYFCLIQFGKQTPITYEREDLTEISLAYGIAIHKSQGSEFDVVIVPIATQHFKMLFRNDNFVLSSTIMSHINSPEERQRCSCVMT